MFEYVSTSYELQSRCGAKVVQDLGWEDDIPIRGTYGTSSIKGVVKERWVVYYRQWSSLKAKRPGWKYRSRPDLVWGCEGFRAWSKNWWCQPIEGELWTSVDMRSLYPSHRVWVPTRLRELQTWLRRLYIRLEAEILQDPVQRIKLRHRSRW